MASSTITDFDGRTVRVGTREAPDLSIGIGIGDGEPAVLLELTPAVALRLAHQLIIDG